MIKISEKLFFKKYGATFASLLGYRQPRKQPRNDLDPPNFCRPSRKDLLKFSILKVVHLDNNSAFCSCAAKQSLALDCNGKCGPRGDREEAEKAQICTTALAFNSHWRAGEPQAA